MSVLEALGKVELSLRFGNRTGQVRARTLRMNIIFFVLSFGSVVVLLFMTVEDDYVSDGKKGMAMKRATEGSILLPRLFIGGV